MFVELLGHRVHVVSFGAGERTIVGIAGAFGSCEIWEQPFELLSRNHRVVAFDHFGAGETRVPVELVTFEQQVAVCEALLDAAGIDRCLLAGDSSMVAVAVEVASRNPDRIEALALVAGSVAHEPDERTMAFVAGLRSRFEETLEAFVAYCIPEDDSDHLRSWLADIIRRTGGERAGALVESFYGVDVSDRLARLAMPTVVVHGELDRVSAGGVDAARDIAALIPRCELVVLPGVGHVPTLTRPHEVAAAIERLLDSAAFGSG